VRIPDGSNIRSVHGIGTHAGSAAGACFVALLLGAQGRRKVDAQLQFDNAPHVTALFWHKITLTQMSC
jgi:hypothetical protein